MQYSELRARAKAALQAAALLTSEGLDESADMEFTKALAHGTLRKVAQGQEVPSSEVAAAMATPESAVYVNSLLSAYDMEVVKDSKRLRHYVTNRLIVESENMDARIRMKALELLGKISDVGLFTERTEVTINNRSTIELEETLREKLYRLRSAGIIEDARIISPPLPSLRASEPVKS